MKTSQLFKGIHSNLFPCGDFKLVTLKVGAHKKQRIEYFVSTHMTSKHTHKTRCEQKNIAKVAEIKPSVVGMLYTK